tara:strand:+ start:10013 stop:10924 length:912 start_codon:yes stop_codon:yes gene_type:complete
MAEFRKGLIWEVLDNPIHGPPRKKLKGRKAVKQCEHQLSGVGSIAKVTVILDHIGFLAMPGGGELGIPVNIAAFLQGWTPILRGLLDLDVLKPKTMRLMSRFACSRLRLHLDHGLLVHTSARCADKDCLFRNVYGQGRSKCCVTESDHLMPAQKTQILKAVPSEKWNDRIPGDRISIAERVVRGWLEPLQVKFARNDRDKAHRLRVGLPLPEAWNGVQFQLPGYGRRFHQATVLGTRSNKAGRVVALELHINDQTTWCKLVALGTGWNIRIHTDCELYMSIPWTSTRTVVRIEKFPEVLFTFS